MSDVAAEPAILSDPPPADATAEVEISIDEQEPTFTQAAVDTLITRRLAKQSRQHERELSELRADLAAAIRDREEFAADAVRAAIQTMRR